jgi:protein PhnA
MSDPHPYASDVQERAGGACELCTAKDGVLTHALSACPSSGADACVLLCPECTQGVEGGDLEGNHWFCLKESAWSEVLAVQVVVWRLLHRSDEAWAQDLLGQMWLPDEVLEWAKPDEEAEGEGEVGFLDINGVALQAGDSATITKDLPVKGGGFVAKRGTLVKGIRLTNDPTHIEASVNKVTIWIKTCFLKKAT